MTQAEKIVGTPGHASAPRAIVVGGGIAGLVAARELSLTGHHVDVFDASSRFGGSVASHEVAGLKLDAGAESFAVRSTAVAELATELGLEASIQTPNPAGSWLYHAADHAKRGGPRALRMPATALLGIPADPWAEDVKAVIGAAGCVRAATDLAMPVTRRQAKEPISLGELVQARMGQAVLDGLVTPIVAGVHSADPTTLDVDTVAPGLRAAMVKHHSLARGVAALRASAPAGSAVAGLAGGMHRLIEALLDELKTAGTGLQVGSTVLSLARKAPTEGFSEGDWEVTVEGQAAPETAERVIIATPGPVAVDLLAGLLPDAAALRPKTGHGIALVTLVVDQPELDAAPRGTGLLVAPGTPGVTAKALTHATAKWGWLADEAGPGTHVLRLSYGRLSDGPDTIPADDSVLGDIAISDASTLMGVRLSAADVVGWDVVRYDAALPFATTGHRDRVDAFRAALAEQPGLDVVGAWLAGTGLASVVADTRARTSITAS
ncbi:MULTISPECIES: protoporphyrinogen oxidase [Micrococcaceae]|uniref:Coproporphyrinogen III oxidase n=1 Tax=Arthrobacter rhombi TaxID=71253 RepID=A0A1R4GL78_9MICC|nr:MULTISPECIES: protoporphyrinogen oxidase [Micrococcaceae]PCC24953.1 protoporphyrinogen oxidase [Glutamicibacter sp. BW78]SJM68981.1 Protoporphyrinogen IX oxidase, aerobic, HemY [Arthrobacter rhombi]